MPAGLNAILLALNDAPLGSVFSGVRKLLVAYLFQTRVRVFAHRINKSLLMSAIIILRSKFFFLLKLHCFTMCNIDKIDKENECCSEFYSVIAVISYEIKKKT